MEYAGGKHEDSKNLTTEIRENVSRRLRAALPNFLISPAERIVTWVSGCPHQGQKALIRLGGLAYFLVTIATFFSLIALGHVLLVFGHWYLAPLVALAIAGRMRTMFITICHQAAHRELTGNDKADRSFALLCSTLTLSYSRDLYVRAHSRSHHSKQVATPDDEDGNIVFELGFVPGQSRGFYWRHAAHVLLSPRTYLLLVGRRAKHVLFTGPNSALIAGWMMVGSMIAAGFLFDAWLTIVIFWLVPVTIGFTAIGLLQQLTEHHWGCMMDKIGTVERIAYVCQGRYLLDPMPERALPFGQRMLAWLRWTARFVFYHAPIRAFVLTGDVQHHDHHHRHPRTKEWTVSAYARLDMMKGDGSKLSVYPYTHAWSLGEAFERVWERMAEAPSLEQVETRKVSAAPEPVFHS